MQNAYRIGAALAVMAALVGVFWPGENWTLDRDAAIAFATALVIWIWSEVDAAKKASAKAAKPHPHDIALARKIRATFNEATRDFLRHHDFGVTFARKYVEPIFEVADGWVGSDYRFQDRRLNKAMENLISVSRELGVLIALKSAPVRGAGGERLQAVPSDEERGNDEFSEHTTKAIDELNDLATQALDAYEELDGLMRAKVPAVYETS